MDTLKNWWELNALWQNALKDVKTSIFHPVVPLQGSRKA
jgi:hypothetical protein